MKQRTIDREHGLHVIAAAVLMALGSTAVAQQPGGSEQSADRPQTQQEQQDRLSQGAQSEQEEGGLQTDAGSSAGSGALDRIAEENDDLSTFVEAVKAAGMEESLTGGTEYTVFAPTNDAWEEMSGLSKDELMQPDNREQLISLLRAHIVADDVDEEMARALQQAQTIDGGTVELSASDDTLRVGDAEVVEDGIQEGSLRVYAIDQVLSPTTLARADDIGSSERQGESDIGAEVESELESERESGLGSERESGLGSDRDSPLGGESDRSTDSESSRDRLGN